MSEELINAIGAIDEAYSWLDDSINCFEKELENRDGKDTAKYSGEISKSINELKFLQSRIRRLNREQKIIKFLIKEWQKQQDYFADMEDANSY